MQRSARNEPVFTCTAKQNEVHSHRSPHLNVPRCARGVLAAQRFTRLDTGVSGGLEIPAHHLPPRKVCSERCTRWPNCHRGMNCGGCRDDNRGCNGNHHFRGMLGSAAVHGVVKGTRHLRWPPNDVAAKPHAALWLHTCMHCCKTAPLFQKYEFRWHKLAISCHPRTPQPSNPRAS